MTTETKISEEARISLYEFATEILNIESDQWRKVSQCRPIVEDVMQRYADTLLADERARIVALERAIEERDGLLKKLETERDCWIFNANELQKAYNKVAEAVTEVAK